MNGQFHDATLLNICVNDKTAATTLVLTFKFLLGFQHLNLIMKVTILINHSSTNHRTAELYQMTEIVASNHAHTGLVKFGDRRNIIESALTQLFQNEMTSSVFILDTPKKGLFRLHDGSIH